MRERGQRDAGAPRLGGRRQRRRAARLRPQRQQQRRVLPSGRARLRLRRQTAQSQSQTSQHRAKRVPPASAPCAAIQLHMAAIVIACDAADTCAAFQDTCPARRAPQRMAPLRHTPEGAHNRRSSGGQSARRCAVISECAWLENSNIQSPVSLQNQRYQGGTTRTGPRACTCHVLARGTMCPHCPPPQAPQRHDMQVRLVLTLQLNGYATLPVPGCRQGLCARLPRELRREALLHGLRAERVQHLVQLPRQQPAAVSQTIGARAARARSSGSTRPPQRRQASRAGMLRSMQRRASPGRSCAWCGCCCARGHAGTAAGVVCVRRRGAAPVGAPQACPRLARALAALAPGPRQAPRQRQPPAAPGRRERPGHGEPPGRPRAWRDSAVP